MYIYINPQSVIYLFYCLGLLRDFCGRDGRTRWARQLVYTYVCNINIDLHMYIYVS